MKRYFGAASTAISSIFSVLRTTTGISINNGAESVTLWERTTQDIDRFPSKYNYVLSRERSVALMPGSTSSNTLITSDGLILVLKDGVLAVSDLFESESDTYDSIDPSDYEVITDRITNYNAPDIKVLAGFGDGTDPLKFLNSFVYSESGVTHFSSQLDYSLPADEYGFYTVSDSLWVSDYREVTTIPILKKPFLYVKGPADLVVSFESGTNTESISLSDVPYTSLDETEKIYRLKFLSISDSDKFLSLKFTTAQTNCTIFLY
jgi:hypothetical protein